MTEDSMKNEMVPEKEMVPDEFSKVIKDFIKDLKFTFPEYETFINKWWKGIEQFNYIEDDEEKNKTYELSQVKSINILFEFCKKKLPPRFFDILYQNEDIFKEDSNIDTEFLPNIHFKNLWQCDISQKTKETIWKYLQLIMFSIIGKLNNKDAFGDTAKIFEAINEDEFKSKLEETLTHMKNLFETSENLQEGINSNPNINMENIPNAEKMHEHISGMLDGKLGQLAREIAEETAANLNMDLEGMSDMKDVFQQLIKNPTKLMGLVKSVGDKLDSKIKSGDLKESELISEATDMMNKMKNMPGMDNIQSMLSKMGMGGLGGKVNMNAMESNLNQKMKMAKTKERIRTKAEANAKARAEQQQNTTQQSEQKPLISEEEILQIFTSGEKVERTPRGSNPSASQTSNKKKKEKK
jgi:hypothetical protein